MFLPQALRYRWSQALVLAGISLLIGTCAVFAPWFARAVEQTVMTETLAGQPLTAAWQLEARPPRSTTGAATAAKPEDLDRLIPADLRPIFTPPSYGLYADVNWRRPSDPPQQQIVGRLFWRDGYCAQLVLVAGRCPQSANEVAVSTVDQTNYGLKVGTALRATPQGYTGGGKLTVVGLYKPADPQSTYWFGRAPIGYSHLVEYPDPSTSDFLLTDRTTFNAVWGQRSTLDTRPIPSVARIDDLQRLRDATSTVNGNAVEAGLFAQNTSGLIGLVDRVQEERKQATTIIPLVMVQVALFGVVVLALALAAVVDQRRPELAIARLRGSTAGRAGRSLSVELGLPVAVGTLAGALTGFALLLIVRATWLHHGAPLELPWTVPAALALALVVGLAVVLVQVRNVVRQPISGLLRRVVPRRRSRALGLVDLTIIVMALAGLVAALTGGGRGPLPVLTPTLLALAAGLAFAHLLLPTAGLVSRQALRSGRFGLALGALQVSRRPAVTRIVAVVAVAAALVSFAGQAASVAERNRDSRAGYETGAEGVLAMNAVSLGDFSEAIDRVDPERRWFTPMVISRPPSPDSLKTMMIEPDSFRRIAYRGNQLTDEFGTLKAPSEPKPIEIRSAQLTVTAATRPMKTVVPGTSNGQVPPPQEPPKSVVLQANLVSLRNGARYLVRFPALPLVPGKPVELRTQVDCLGGCSLLRLGIGREPNDMTGVRGDVFISKVASDDQPSIALGRAEDWQPVKQLGADQGTIAATSAGQGLTLAVTSLGNDQFLQYATVPQVVPALVTPDFAYNDTSTSPALDASPLPLRKLDLNGPVNRYPDHTAVVDLETVRRLGGTVDESTTDFELWLNAEGLANAQNIIDQLGKAGFAAELADRRADRIASYGRSASALALQLTPVVGVAGWALAIVVLLLMVVTSWRSRAQDYASLRITGVPASTTGRAARWEQTGPVALAVLLGSVCGVVGAQVALPMIPLFADAGGPIPLELDTNWLVAVVLWLAGTVVLTTATLLLGTGVNRRAGYSRIREELT